MALNPADLTVLEGLEKAYAAANQSLTTEPTADTTNQWSAALREFIPALHRAAPALFAALREAWAREVEREIRISQLVEAGRADSLADAAHFRRINIERLDVEWTGGGVHLTNEHGRTADGSDLRTALAKLPEVKK